MIQKGDHLRVWREVPGFWHHGIAVDTHVVIHYSGEVTSKANASICLTSLADFCDGSQPEVVQYSRIVDRDTTIWRAQSRLGESDYHVLFNNCEHFATWCVTGEHESAQVGSLPVGAALAVPIAKGAATGITLAAMIVGAPVVAAVAAPVAGVLAAREAWKRLSRK